MNKYIVASLAKRRINDLISDEASVETRANAARWYAEMMLDKFFSAQIKINEEREDVFHNMGLSEKIEELKRFYQPSGFIEDLYYIKDIGDRGSHYHPKRPEVTKKEVEKAVKKSLGLFDFALINLLEDGGLKKSNATATIFSTFLPSVRARVLKKITNTSNPTNNSDYNTQLLWKLAMATLKEGNRNKALRDVDTWGKKGLISKADTDLWKSELNKLHDVQELLPIALNIADCKRNFDDCLRGISEEEKKINKELISLFEIMLDQIKPSEMGGKQPNYTI